MAFRLAAHLEQGIVRLPLAEGDNLVGSEPSCPVRLPHPSVSRRHALLRVEGAALLLEDLGSANGTLAGSQRVHSRAITPGEPLYFGRVAAVVEEIAESDLQPAFELARPHGTKAAPAAEASGSRAGSSTASLAPLETFTLDHLPGLLAAVGVGDSREQLAQRVGAALFTVLPAASVEVLETRRGEEGMLFAAHFPDAPGGETERLERHGVHTLVRVEFSGSGFAELYAPLAEAALRLILLADRRGRRESADERASLGSLPALPDPPTVVPQVRQIYQDAARVARGDVGVLITGESGTGKEVLARYLHAASPRAAAPFVALNCAALPRDLLEAELFGIERGVATGVDSRPGKFELADGGTLFLDEVGDMAAETQASILRVLQEKEVYRLGSARPRPARTRVVAATNRDLGNLLADGRFREDLFHRIATWVVELPPLRRRRADIANLAAWFLAREAARHGLDSGGLSRAAVDALTHYGWPGNIRQLENEIARAVLFLQPGEMLDSARLSPAIRQAGSGLPQGGTLEQTLAGVERDEILLALERARGDVAAACTSLGVSRATLYRRMKTLEIAAGEGRATR
jgi:DNA-binding NtrC family response regulator